MPLSFGRVPEAPNQTGELGQTLKQMGATKRIISHASRSVMIFPLLLSKIPNIFRPIVSQMPTVGLQISTEIPKCVLSLRQLLWPIWQEELNHAVITIVKWTVVSIPNLQGNVHN